MSRTVGAPCAADCHYSHCRAVFEQYQFENAAATASDAELAVKNLNQCRSCAFAPGPCDDATCRYECNDFAAFPTSRSPEESCSGCSGAQLCKPGANAYNDRAPWGETPFFSATCPRKCENALILCRAEPVEAACDQPYDASLDQVKDDFNLLGHQCAGGYDMLFGKIITQLQESRELMLVENDGNAFQDVSEDARNSLRDIFHTHTYDAFVANTSASSGGDICQNNYALKYSRHACDIHPCCRYAEGACAPLLSTESGSECQTAFDNWRGGQAWWTTYGTPMFLK